MSKLITAALFTLAVLTIIASPSHSDDTKTYPGIMCVQNLGGIRDPTPEGALKNPSNSPTTMHVLCPIVRDLPSFDARLGYVEVVSYNPTLSPISCRVRSCLGSCSDGRLASSDTRRFWDNVSTPPPPARAGWVHGSWPALVSHHLVCQIPPGASIHSYSVWETDQ